MKNPKGPTAASTIQPFLGIAPLLYDGPLADMCLVLLQRAGRYAFRPPVLFRVSNCFSFILLVLFLYVCSFFCRR